MVFRNVIIVVLAGLLLFLLKTLNDGNSRQQELNQLLAAMQARLNTAMEAARKVGEGLAPDGKRVEEPLKTAGKQEAKGQGQGSAMTREEALRPVSPQRREILPPPVKSGGRGQGEGDAQASDTVWTIQPAKSNPGGAASAPVSRGRNLMDHGEFDTMLRELNSAETFLQGKGQHNLNNRAPDTPQIKKGVINDQAGTDRLPDEFDFEGNDSPDTSLEGDAPGREGDDSACNLHPLGKKTVSSAKNLGVEPSLALALVEVESNFQPNARSPKGACGLAQVMPGTAALYGVDRFELFRPDANLHVGLTYLKEMLELFDGRLDLALAAYNAGPGAVVDAGYRVPPYSETRAYVAKVMACLSINRKKFSRC